MIIFINETHIFVVTCHISPKNKSNPSTHRSEVVPVLSNHDDMWNALYILLVYLSAKQILLFSVFSLFIELKTYVH
jgi:hypothetical protein